MSALCRCSLCGGPLYRRSYAKAIDLIRRQQAERALELLDLMASTSWRRRQPNAPRRKP